MSIPLRCVRCLLDGKRLPTTLDHLGRDNYAWMPVVTVAGGDALCADHAKTAIAERRKAKP